MTSKELIHAEIDSIGEENLDELYGVIKRFVEAKAAQPETGILSKLRSVKIEAPPDFSANLDMYLSGEKDVDDSIH